jgi:hypothetical protein
MQLLELRGGYLYQHRPDIIPSGYLCNEEIMLWAAYYEQRKKEAKKWQTSSAP